MNKNKSLGETDGGSSIEDQDKLKSGANSAVSQLSG